MGLLTKKHHLLQLTWLGKKGSGWVSASSLPSPSALHHHLGQPSWDILLRSTCWNSFNISFWYHLSLLYLDILSLHKYMCLSPSNKILLWISSYWPRSLLLCTLWLLQSFTHFPTSHLTHAPEKSTELSSLPTSSCSLVNQLANPLDTFKPYLTWSQSWTFLTISIS